MKPNPMIDKTRQDKTRQDKLSLSLCAVHKNKHTLFKDAFCLDAGAGCVFLHANPKYLNHRA